MKVKELIKALQNCHEDSEVVVGGEAIYFIEELPGYYDGCYQKLIQDPSKDPYYNITGIEWSRSNTKVRLNLMSLEDIIYNCNTPEELSNLEYKFTNLSFETIEQIKLKIKTLNNEVLKILKEKKI